MFTHPSQPAFYSDMEGVDESETAVGTATFSENLNPNVPEFIPVISGLEETKKYAGTEADGEIDECVEAIEDKLKFDDASKPNEGSNGESCDLGRY